MGLPKRVLKKHWTRASITRPHMVSWSTVPLLSAYPAFSIINQTTFWELNEWYVIAIIAACIVEAALVAWLLLTRARRRQAEKESARLKSVAEAEHRHLNEVVSNVPGVVWEARVDPGSHRLKTRFVSEYVEEMLGYSVEEWLSTPGLELELVYEGDRERVTHERDEILVSKKGGVLQYRWVAKDSRVVWVAAHLTPILDESGKVVGMRGVMLDITEQKLSEVAGGVNEERNRAILRAIPDLMFLQSRDGTYLDFHAKTIKDLLVPPEKFLGKNMREVLPPDLANRILSCFEESWEAGEPKILEYDLPINGGRRWFEARIVRSGDGFLTVVRDTTERKSIEEALRQSEAQFRNMADTAPVMIWLSGTDKLCTYLNKKWFEFTGRGFEEELGAGWVDGVHQEDYVRCLETYHTAFDSRQLFKMEYRLRRADGVYRWVLDCGAPRFSSDGEFLGYIGSCVDITERKESEEALRKTHEELSQLKNQLEAENIYLQQELKMDHTFGEIVGQSDAIKYVLFKINQVAPTDSTVLIMGETGTGKELVARAIHSASKRANRPLIKVNSAALSPSLIESELFGHEKGAFTGAGARKIGRFELADGGTIFLDEIGELPSELQVKLLRVIQEGELERVGSTKTIKIDVRIIAATNRDLRREVDKGTFREDLWYRLNVFPITVPPLKQRREDIPALVEHFVEKSAKKFGKAINSVSAKTMENLQSHSWPGNVRELANVIERAVIHSQGNVLHLADRFEPAPEPLPASAESLEKVERDYILSTLENTGWRIEGLHGAARVLGLNPSTLRTRMAKLQIQKRPMHGRGNGG